MLIIRSHSFEISNPHLSAGKNRLGIAYSKKGMHKEAMVEFQTALEINPGFSDAYYNLGIVYETLGDYRRTKECLEKALEFNPELRDLREYLQKLEMRGY